MMLLLLREWLNWDLDAKTGVASSTKVTVIINQNSRRDIGLLTMELFNWSSTFKNHKIKINLKKLLQYCIMGF